MINLFGDLSELQSTSFKRQYINYAAITLLLRPTCLGFGPLLEGKADTLKLFISHNLGSEGCDQGDFMSSLRLT